MQFYEVQVWLAGRGAMRQLIKATSMDHALAAARSKYPGGVVDVPPQAAGKPRLARSRTSPSVAAKARTKMAEAKQVTQPAQWAQEAWAKVQADQRRVDFLEKLYAEDGRDRKGHPHHATYTGLYLQYLDQMNVEHVNTEL
jgi:hypothetical protein